VDLGGTEYAIINAPNEQTSRYVREGQTIANGQVLVKRIEVQESGEPVVVLEENGIEVSRRIGENGIGEGTA
jgi:hypothetical protein